MRKPYWIKERHNPQLGVYYVAMGRMSVVDAGIHETQTLYGENFMHRFDSLQDYNYRLAELKEAGMKVQ